MGSDSRALLVPFPNRFQLRSQLRIACHGEKGLELWNGAYLSGAEFLPILGLGIPPQRPLERLRLSLSRVLQCYIPGIDQFAREGGEIGEFQGFTIR